MKGDRTQGKRLYRGEGGVLNLEPASYGKVSSQEFLFRAPRGPARKLSGHQLIFNEDSTISVFPSFDSPEWHGWIDHDVWIEV